MSPRFLQRYFGENPFRRGPDTGDSILRSRRVLVRNSVARSHSHLYKKASPQATPASAEENAALRRSESVAGSYDEDVAGRIALVSNIYLNHELSRPMQVKGPSPPRRRLTKRKPPSREAS